MNSEPLLSPGLWERIPPEVQAYIRALEARVAALEAMVQQLREQLQPDSHTSSPPPVERSASGCGETTAAPTQRAPARWATRT
jgi:hypothetical protein